MTSKVDVINLLQNEKYHKTITVPEAADRTEKFTVYKILLQITPEKSLDEEINTFVVWRRFRDIHKLYCKLEMVHKQLYLKGQYPGLAKPDFFGRHDPQVVEERRQSTETFLDFAVKNSILCKTDLFHSFFQGAQLYTKSLDEPPNSPVLVPETVPFCLSTSSDDCDDHPESSEATAIQITLDDHSATHPAEGLAVFDPYLGVEPSKEPPVSNFALLSSVMETEPGSQNTLSQNSCTSEILLHRMPKNESASDVAKERLNILAPIRVIRSTGNLNIGNSPPRQQSPDIFNRPWFKKATTSSPQKKSQQTNIPAADYLVQAGEFISAAQKSEAECVYDFAFTLYKSAVLLLLNGVQEEKDLTRRNAVRVQMTKYLRRAEKLYRKHLATNSSEEFMIDSLSIRFASDVNLIGLLGSYTELKQYKCVGMLSPKVQVVADINTNELYAIKFIDKSCYGAQLNQAVNQCVPVHIPFMVKIFRFWDLDNCTILLLELAYSGRLWDHLKLYFKLKRQEFYKSCVYHFHTPRSSGRKVLFSVGDPKPDPISSKRQSMDDFDECSPDIHGPTDGMVFRNCNRSAGERFSTDFTEPYSGGTKIGDHGIFHTDLSHQIFHDGSFENLIRKWAAQIIIGVSHLHIEGMICRDLNPNNLLLDDKNNILLSYFCTWNGHHYRLDENCVEMFYCAPEILHLNYDLVSKGCDWWSLGVILYELAAGLPIYLFFPQGINAHSQIIFPDDLSLELKDLISKLLRFDVDERLGCGTDGEEILKAHPFFDGINWAKLESNN